MITEATTLMSQWAKHAEYGVNAMIDTIGRNKASTGAYPRPKDVEIYDDCSDESVAVELDPAKVPALVIFCDSDIDVAMAFRDPKVLKQTGTGLLIVYSYIVRETPPLKARIDGGIVLRAVLRNLNRFNTSHFNAPRKLNDISVSQVASARMQRVAGSVGRSTLAGFVIANLEVLNHAP